MVMNKYPKNKIFLSYMFLGSLIGSLLTVSIIAIYIGLFYYNSEPFIDIILEFMAFILIYGLIGVAVGIIPASITGLYIIKQKIYKNYWQDYMELGLVGFLVSLLFYSAICFYIYDGDSELIQPVAIFILATSIVGAISSIITGHLVLPKSLNKVNGNE